MDKRKKANQQVKDRLFAALLTSAGERDFSQLKVTELVERSGVARASFYRNFDSMEGIVDYGIQRMASLYHEGKPSAREDFHDRQVMLYRFRFFYDHADVVLAFHRAHVSPALLDVITDCEIDASGDMPASPIERYESYYFTGAFYNMLVCWLEGGMREAPEAMADEFLRIAGEHEVLCD
ncbi:MAG: TetR/AcrR family transcriptional regulator [Gordonibacter sp.]|uniref:TetR/AcrR family transcriptional regulator n=1 Tax=Gordonibacter sp. TaxID=1968902 RepID=UPI002FCC6349